MLNNEQTQILEQAIFLLIKLRNEQSIDNWEEKRARELEQRSRPLRLTETKSTNSDEEHPTPPFDNDKNENWYRLLKFTEKEILQMPKKLRIVIRELNCTVYARKRTTGRYKCSYEIRFNRNGFNISASGKTKEEAKKRFILKAKIIEEQQNCTAPAIPKDFNGFATFWFENFHIARVIEKTYKNNLGLYNRHIKPKFNNYLLSEITPNFLKTFLNGLPGNGKTSDDVRSILNQIFETAIINGKLKQNPLSTFAYIQHERENGIELTYNEEITLLTKTKNTVYETIFAVILFCGLRINEYKTAYIDGKFIVAINSKQKNGKVEYKKIPICSFLYAILNGCTELPKRHDTSIRNKYKEILPKHTLKDLRKTFNTRCIKCKVDTFARKKYMGHSVGKLDKTYVGNIDDYLLTEGKKLEKWYSYPKCTPNSDE